MAAKPIKFFKPVTKAGEQVYRSECGRYEKRYDGRGKWVVVESPDAFGTHAYHVLYVERIEQVAVDKLAVYEAERLRRLEPRS